MGIRRPSIEATLLSPKLRKLHKDTPARVRRSIRLLRKYVILTPGTLKVEVMHNDPDNNKVLARALESHADYVVSGDHHLTD
jgi:hypothetical protein